MTLIAQITDLHLRDDGNDPAHDPAEALRRAYGRIAALDIAPDAILFTGDIIDRSARSYDAAVCLLRMAPVPLLPLPGNHDRPDEFRAAFGEWADFQPAHLSFSKVVGNILVIALDSNLEGGRAGVDEVRLDWLAHVIANADRPALLALHHPPFPTGLPHFDKKGFTGADKLAALVEDSAVCRVITGHCHRGIQTLWAGVAATTTRAIGHALSVSLSGAFAHQPINAAPGWALHDFRSGVPVSHEMSA